MKSNGKNTYDENRRKSIDGLLNSHDREVPFFAEGDICEEIYVPIQDGEIKVFHYKPKKNEGKRPIIFGPGWGSSQWAWKDFTIPFYEKQEYYYLETREKNTSKIKRSRKVKFHAEQSAKDIAEAIKFLGLDNKDFVLMGTSYTGGAILNGLAKKYFKVPTAVVFQPLKTFKKQRKITIIFFPFPPFMLNLFKHLFVNIALLGMKNKEQKNRIKNYIVEGDAWKWRRGGIDMFNYDLEKLLPQIEDEVFLFHGPKDRYHPDYIFEEMTKAMPKGRYFHMQCANDKRQLLAGVIGFEFTKISKEDGIPNSLKPFEIKLEKENH